MKTEITDQVLASAPAASLRGRVVLLTGASGRVGAPLASALAAAGADVALCARRLAPLRAAARRAAAHGGRVYAARCDVRSPAQVRRFVREAARRLGRVDILVNGAGTRGPVRPLARCTPAEWSQVLGTNLDGAFHMSREVLNAGMLRRRSGVILNLSSEALRGPVPGRAAYTASKCALEGLTLALARELANSGVRVNAFNPCAIAGSLPAEAAAALLFLLGDASAGRTGELFGLEEAGLDPRHAGPSRFRVFVYDPG